MPTRPAGLDMKMSSDRVKDEDDQLSSDDNRSAQLLPCSLSPSRARRCCNLSVKVNYEPHHHHHHRRKYSESSTRKWSSLVLILLVSLTSAQRTVPASNTTFAYFEDLSNEQFSHMTINDYTGRIYIGGVNRIYQLSPGLTLEAIAEMGPQLDSTDCPASRVCSPESKVETKYWNKALVIDYPQSKLLSCGSLFQGVCSVHKLDNVSVYNTPANVSVVANNSTASTVAFIAPGPKLSRSHVLYVGVTYTKNGPYRSDIPTVSSRSLDPNSMFAIAATGVTAGTRLLVNSLALDKFPIHYVYGFVAKGFSYFLTVQKMSVDQPLPIVSKLVRICQSDANYYSYTEVPLVCKSPDGVDFNLAQAAYVGRPGSELAVSLGISAQDEVLYVVFSKQKGDTEQFNVPSNQSALCVYAISAIHRKFTQNIQHCFYGRGSLGLDFVNPTQNCVPTQVQINDEFCGMDVNTPLGGSMAMEAAPVVMYKNVHLTSVAATATHDYTVAFLGTANGHLKKAVVESVRSAFEYADVVIDERSRINGDMYFDTKNDKNYLYVMSERKVSLLKVQECQMYKTCGECLGARDPYCGWCSLENKCSLRSDCAEAAVDPLYWLSYKSGKCTTITQVHPPQIQRTTARTLNLLIDNLPALEGQYLCAFTAMGKTQTTNATRSPNGINCPTPPTDTLPAIPPGHHHFTAKLSVRMNTGPDFVATNFTFYDCSSYSSCTHCVSSNFPCDWCVGGHRCTHDTGENCRNDVLVTGISSVGPSIRSGPKFCPRLNANITGSEVLVPSGSSRRVQVKVENLPHFIVSTRFVCQFNIEGRVKSVNAHVLGDTIYCDEMRFSFSANAANVTAAFAVIWDASKPLDNPDNVHVIVYRCQGMADNCGFCLELPVKYGCGWCHDQCDVQTECKVRHPSHEDMKWLDKEQTCPDPQITDFEPRSGPLEGGTNITVEGINLGRTFEDIANGIHVAHEQNGASVGFIACIPYRESYVKTSRITCQVQSPYNSTQRIFSGGTVSGPMVVKVQNDYTARSQGITYSFVDPHINSMEPSKGPLSGGTKLTIWGLHMDAGSRVEAYLGSHNCLVVNRTSNKAECITSGRQSKGEDRLRMKFDNGERVFSGYQFLFVEDPTITVVESGLTGQRGIPKGIPAGGILIAVKGTDLNSVQRPMMYVEVYGLRYNSSCIVESATDMKCKSPSVPPELISHRFGEHGEFLELHYGFIMDKVPGVQDLTKRHYNPFQKFQMFPDPVYFGFPEEDGIKYYKSDYLTINGQNLDRASQEGDVHVRIGTSFCNVTSLSRNQLTCRPPTVQPAALSADGRPDHRRMPDVVVFIGENLNYTIGKLSYDLPPDLRPVGANLPKPVLIAVMAGSSILVVIVIIILIAYRRKSTESSRVLKSMQEQMDVLELRVASECKEAFAELQTEMTDLTGDITSGGIPFQDYRIYAMNVLFPNIEDHAVLREMNIDPHKKPYIERGLRNFGQLIMNKTFLLLFIRTLESNRYFSMRDRVNVASLIMVTLQGKMEYCTDILKTLLAELIEKCMESKSHPKLLLRRTESVAEKMLSSWFTFLLYKFLRECAGEPSYLLYRAIKHQVEKGPVDSCTSEARYSLSEEKLIRQSVDYKALTVFVSVSHQTAYVSGLEPILGENIEHPVKVLDCDTISQVKEKALDFIYKNVSYSQRPSKDDLDLEWRTGQSGRIILSDEDTTSRIDSEWKRLNNLAHYKVHEGSSLTLVPRQSSSMYNISLLSDKMDKSGHKYETLNFGAFNKTSSPPPAFQSRPTSPLHHVHHHHHNDVESGGYKFWHLVRHHEHHEQKDGERTNKMVSEIYLTRLLATKGTLQKFVDDLFETIFGTAQRGTHLPLAIKYMFDFLDDQALMHGITDPETVHTWKSNSLPLRFWVNLIKNPNFIFDINKSNIVDSCLSVVAQTFMDACSTSDHRLGKDSPSSKLLYAKDIPIYKDWVERYYREIQCMPAISDQDMNAMLAEESRIHAHEFNTNVALYELYNYAVKYNDQLMQTLDEDEFSRKNKLAFKLEQVYAIMAGEVDA